MNNGWYPLATRRPVINHGGPMSADLGLILHVQQGNNSPYSWFNNSESQASSTFWVAKDGRIEQYVACGIVPWTQGTGNHTYHSVETEGFDTEPLTQAQINSLARIYSWGKWPTKLAEHPGDSGFGWHGMGGQPWGGHLGCPGNIRKSQRQTILNLITKGSDLLNVPTVNAHDVGHPNAIASIKALSKVINPAADLSTPDELDAAIRFFQAKEGLTVDGWVGPITATKLAESAWN